MGAFIFLDSFLILLSLQVVAVVAECLEVGSVVEPVAAYRPRFDMVHAGGGLDDAVPLAFRAEWMLGPEGPGEFRPSAGVVRVGGPLSPVAGRLTLAPGEIHGAGCS